MMPFEHSEFLIFWNYEEVPDYSFFVPFETGGFQNDPYLHIHKTCIPGMQTASFFIQD
jgi:hypothetical protein